MEVKFYHCKHCGKVIMILNDATTPTVCCGDQMTLLKSGITDGDTEKHVPVVTVSDNTATVNIGSKDHPMTKEHYIQWICLVTTKSVYFRYLTPDCKPHAVFGLCPDEKVVECYEFCNIHKLFKCMKKDS